MSFERDDDDEHADAVHEARISRCRSCNAQIIWFKTPAGKNMPVNANSVERGDEVLDIKRHISHFATCPTAPQHRRRK